MVPCCAGDLIPKLYDSILFLDSNNEHFEKIQEKEGDFDKFKVFLTWYLDICQAYPGYILEIVN
jgi:hypothetical protein